MDLYFYSGNHNYPFINGEGLCKPDHHFNPKFINSWRFETEYALGHRYDKLYPDLDHHAIPVLQALYSMNFPNLMAHVRLFFCTGNNSDGIDNQDSLIILFSSKPKEKDSKKWASCILEDEKYIQVYHVCSCEILLKVLYSETQNNWVEFFQKKFDNAIKARYTEVRHAEEQLIDTRKVYEAYITMFQ